MTQQRSRRRIQVPCAAVAAASLLALSGCGSGSSKATTGAAPAPKPAANAATTRPQFIARADAICAQVNVRFKPVEQRLEALARGSESALRSEGPAVIRQGAKITREGIAQLQALPVPSGDAPTVGKIITALNNEAADIDNIAAATANGEASGIEAAKKAEQTTKATYRGLAQGYGLKVCGARP
jgi:hypothetical protein